MNTLKTIFKGEPGGTPHAPAVCFYVPSKEMVADLPPDSSGYWEWILGWLASGKAPLGYDGPFSWTVQTFLHLRDAGFPCSITAEIPDKGIVITHSDFIPDSWVPHEGICLVEIKPDRIIKCALAQHIIVQSPADPLRIGHRQWLWQTHYVPFWPQPGLIPRNPDRGEIFKNVAYIGNQNQLDKNLKSAGPRLEKLGLTWKMPPRNQWHDYSQIDAIVAVRKSPLELAANKPPSKLLNAWCAGVPAVLSPDPAYERLRKNRLDYLRARDGNEVLEQLMRLKGAPDLRREMAEWGRKRSSDFTQDKVTAVWRELILKKLIPNYHRHQTHWNYWRLIHRLKNLRLKGR